MGIVIAILLFLILWAIAPELVALVFKIALGLLVWVLVLGGIGVAILVAG